MKLVSINVYPIKSLEAVPLKKALAKEAGLTFDRRFVIVDFNGRFITQRENVNLTRIGAQIQNNQITLFDKRDSKNRFTFTNNEYSSKRKEIQVWKHRIEANIMSSNLNEWMSAIIGQPCQIAILDSESNRTKSIIVKPYKTKLSFADGYPYLITSVPSLTDLNTRLEVPIPMNRFRPNLVLSDCQSYEEDHLKEFQIGTAKFRFSKKCGRCIVTTTDQDTGERFKEPLATLSTYRKEGKAINFGVYAICVEEGMVNVGDEVVRSFSLLN